MSHKRKKKGSYSLATLIFALLFVAGVTLAAEWLRNNIDPVGKQDDIISTIEGQESVATSANSTCPEDKLWELAQITSSRPEQVIEHLAYTVSFNPEWNIPNWVAYCLTAEETEGELTRSDHFLPDPLVEGDAVITRDYSNSGYDRGHMAPAADMKWSDQAMHECFYMTNMCPQHHSNNAGDWKDLEELGRDLAKKYQKIYICCGPIVTDASHTIGQERKIVVPQQFYKVFLRQKSDGQWTAIGFILDNAPANKPLMTYMHSVDEVEAATGIDLFYQLPDEVEAVVEADYKVDDWIVDTRAH